jgi:uncharacterized protein YraI
MGLKILPRLGMGAVLLALCAGAWAQNAMTTTSADLYAGPDDSYPEVAELDSNTPLQVYGCLDDWSWCDVGYQDARGWLYSPNITYMYQGGYVPLYTYAPSLGIAVVPFSVDVYWGRYYQARPWFARRQDWAHRSINHHRPPGPPPSAGPPPRPAGGPREAARPEDHPLHLGRAESPHNEALPHNEAPPHAQEARPPVGPRPEQQHATPPPPVPQRDDRANGPGRTAPPAHEERAKPDDHPRPPPKDKEEEHPH